MIELTKEQREDILNQAVAYAHLLSISRKHRNQEYEFPAEDKDLWTWANILKEHQDRTGLEMIDNSKLTDLILFTGQLVKIQEEPQE